MCIRVYRAAAAAAIAKIMRFATGALGERWRQKHRQKADNPNLCGAKTAPP